MKILIQRVLEARVTVNQKIISEIDKGLLSLICFEKGDDDKILEKYLTKLSKLRIFEDENGKMNLSLLDLNLPQILVSQFTLAANLWEGNRPGFSQSMEPGLAKELYDKALAYSNQIGIRTLRGEFGADMKIHLINDGPVTFML